MQRFHVFSKDNNQRFYRPFRYTVEQVLDLLEDDIDGEIENEAAFDVAIGMPDENDETDCDSDNEDSPTCDPTHLGKGILTAPCELQRVGKKKDETDHKQFADAKSKLKWQKGPTKHPILLPEPNVSLSDEAQSKIDAVEYPIDFFLLLWDADLISTIVRESNLYAQNKGVQLDLSEDELYKVIGILLLSGYNTLPSVKNYWSSENDMHNDLVTSAIPRNRFLTILRHLHVAHTIHPEDKAWKLRRVIDGLNSNFMKFMKMNSSLSIDESMIEYFGRHPYKQFIRGKPIRFGFKVWLLCSADGSCHQFKLYTGAEEQRHFGLGESVVENFSDLIPAGCHVFIDNYFTSVRLLMLMSERLIGCTGTIRKNRLRGGQQMLTEEKELRKNQRGFSEVISTDGVNVVQWLDNKGVLIASNTLAVDPHVTCKRFSKLEKKNVTLPQPTAIKMYNRNMGGVDLMDQSINNYRCRIRIRKWYFKIFTWMMDLACANAWQLFRNKDCNHNASYLQFRRKVVLSLLSQNVHYHKPAKLRRIEHIIVRDTEGKRMRRKVCQSNTIYRCNSCTIALHSNCFDAFHARF